MPAVPKCKSVTTEHSPTSFNISHHERATHSALLTLKGGRVHKKITRKILFIYLFLVPQSPAACVDTTQPPVTAHILAQGAPQAQVPHRGNNIKEKQKSSGTDLNPRKTPSPSDAQLTFISLPRHTKGLIIITFLNH